MSLFRCGWLVQEIRVLFWHKLKLNSPKNETWFLMRKSTDRVKSLGPISLWPLPSQYYKFCPPCPPLNFVGGGFSQSGYHIYLLARNPFQSYNLKGCKQTIRKKVISSPARQKNRMGKTKSDVLIFVVSVMSFISCLRCTYSV